MRTIADSIFEHRRDGKRETFSFRRWLAGALRIRSERDQCLRLTKLISRLPAPISPIDHAPELAEYSMRHGVRS